MPKLYSNRCVERSNREGWQVAMVKFETAGWGRRLILTGGTNFTRPQETFTETAIDRLTRAS
jgi:hypothetical protein